MGIFDDIVDGIEETWDHTTDGVKQGFNAVVELPGKVVDQVRDVPQKLADTAVNAVGATGSLLQGNFDEVKDKAAALARSYTDTGTTLLHVGPVSLSGTGKKP